MPTPKSLSPIMSPATTEAGKPDLRAETNVSTLDNGGGIPPEFPPKSPPLHMKKLPAICRQQRNDSGTVRTPISDSSAPVSSIPVAIGSSSPESFNKHDHIRAHSRKRPDQSVMDTGRSFKMSQQTAQRGKSSQTSSSEMEGADTWKLPRGVPAMETVAKLLSPEREKLCQAPVGQVEGFEVLTPRDMASLSKELRALDKRCEYLRKTYKSLRAGRRDLHTRMISYLKKGETVVFSRESLVKQEEALVELDLSIEDWVLKIEQAENRRLRICQKLFEHIAAAIALPSATSPNDAAEATSQSLVKAGSVDSPHRMGRDA